MRARDAGTRELRERVGALLGDDGIHNFVDGTMIGASLPWDPREPHYHSFFIYESDPMTGFPMAIAGNAGRPSIRVWRTESLRTPKRMLVRRLRPRLEWLELLVIDADAQAAEEPPPLAVLPGN